ncbi:MAG: DMT family transporter [Bauldia sp.]|uniref:DMT family transporter n=1 Tax=Bauldia sp. TaxID=2575872 RepID=UPI001D4DA49F|nr:DMT family transporter [Bauldia sp.]MCB1495965.1 DMT family transporter [Bauldia sp.]
MHKIPFLLAALGVGGTVALQPILNAEVARRLGSPVVAAFLSIMVSFLLCSLYVVFNRPTIQWAVIGAMPWYLWIGGSIGFLFVIGTLWIAPALGAATLFGAVIAGQMIMATVIDWTGLAGYQGHSFDPMRIVAILLVLAGVLIFQRSA